MNPGGCTPHSAPPRRAYQQLPYGSTGLVTPRSRGSFNFSSCEPLIPLYPLQKPLLKAPEQSQNQYPQHYLPATRIRSIHDLAADFTSRTAKAPPHNPGLQPVPRAENQGAAPRVKNPFLTMQADCGD